MLETLINTILMRGIQGRLKQCFMSEIAEEFLELLLRGMALMFLLDRQFRKGIQDFIACHPWVIVSVHLLVLGLEADASFGALIGEVEYVYGSSGPLRGDYQLGSFG